METGGNQNKFEAQKKRVLKTLAKHPATMLMLSVETGILRANICRYFAEFEKVGKIHRVIKKPCAISKIPAVYYAVTQTLFEK